MRPVSSERNISLLLFGHFISKAGTALFDIAVVLWLTGQTGAAGIVGVVMMLAKLPEAILAPLSGAVVDSASRKGVLAVSDLAAGVVVLAVSTGCLFFPGDRRALLVLVAAGSVLVGIADSFLNPAVAAFIPELAPDERLQTVNSAYRFLTGGATLAGQCGAGLLFAILGAPLLFAANGASYLISAWAVWRISIPRKTRAPAAAGGKLREIPGSLKEGLAYVGRHEGLKGFLMAICVYHFFISPFTVVMPFYISRVLVMPPQWYGYFMACFGSGLLGGFLLAGLLGLSGSGRASLVVTCLGVSAAGYALIGLLRQVFPVMAVIFLIGASIAVIVVSLQTIIQVSTPKSMHGRIFGLYHTLSTASIPAGMGFFGFALDGLSRINPSSPNAPAHIFLASGIALLGVVLFLLAKPSFRDFLSAKA